jgi:hypothetical protein
MMWIDWVYLIIAMAVMSIGGLNARSIVRKGASSYSVMKIAVVGAAWGAILALSVFIGAFAAPVTVVFLLVIWGLMAAGYVGFRPDPIDQAGKARQIAVVAMLGYILALATLLFVS